MPVEFKLPLVGENVDSVDIGQVLVKEGDTVSKEQLVAEIETAKAVLELTSPYAGKVVKVHIKTGDKVPVGGVVLTIEEGAASVSAPASEAPKSAPAPAKPSSPAPAAPAPSTAVAVTAKGSTALANGDRSKPAPASPSVRRFARELGVELHAVTPTGPHGRITLTDVQNFVKTSLVSPTVVMGLPSAPPLPDFAKFGVVQRQPMNKVARTSATGLSIAWQTIPHVTQHDSVDITDLEAGRKRLVKAKGDSAPKVTMTVLAMKAVVAALKQFPHFNSSIDMAAGEVILKSYYHVGIAVDTENGLLVPVIRDVDKKSIMDLAEELTGIASRARARKLTLDDMTGGTFTITNLGGIGGSTFTPIVNYPEVAILGMSRAKMEPVFINGAFEPRLMLPLSLSYDHRVINGADGARFLNKVGNLLADPFELLSEV